MEKVLSELIDWIKNRITSPLLSTFMISWLLVNRNFIYTMLFVDENFIFQRDGLLKNEYLSHMFYNHELVTKLIWYIHSDIWINLWATIIKSLMPLLSEIWIGWLSMAIRFLVPLIIVLLIYGVINPFDKCVYERDQKHLYKKKSIQEIEEGKYLDIAILTSKKKSELSILQEREELKKEYKELVKEYESNFKEDNFTFILQTLESFINENVEVPIGRITKEIIDFFEEKWIISKWGINHPRKISLTEKGKKMLQNISYF